MGHELTAQEGIAIMDGDGVIRDFNPAAERMFGWAGHEVIGRELAQLIAPGRHRESDLADGLAMAPGKAGPGSWGRAQLCVILRSA